MVEKDEEQQEGYWPRVADAVLQRALRASGAVQIVGAKWCGKTETAKQQAQSAVYLQDPDEGPSLVALAEVRPSVLLEGAEPHLIDEWQMAPQLWDAVRFAVDQGKGKGRFILTGSATPKKRPKHSGVGRISRMHMRPMSLFESRESTGAVSLAGLFDGAAEVGALSDRSIEDIAFALCRGGWPEAVLESDPEIALDQAKDYVAELLDSDIDEMDDKKRNSTWLRAILRSYARNLSTEASQATIAADMGASPLRRTRSRTISTRFGAPTLPRICRHGIRRCAPRPPCAPVRRGTSATRASGRPCWARLPGSSCWTSTPSGCSSNRCACVTCVCTRPSSGEPSTTIAIRRASRPMPSSSWMTAAGGPSR